jgi:hypothetical protein
MALSETQREEILAQARAIVRTSAARVVSGPDDGLPSCPSAPPSEAAAATIEEFASRDHVAAAAPSPWSQARYREREFFEIAALEKRAATASRRRVEAQHRQRASSASDEVAKLRAETVELAKASSTLGDVLVERLEAQAGEIADLRAKLAIATARIDDLVAARPSPSLPPDELPKGFLTPRRLSS